MQTTTSIDGRGVIRAAAWTEVPMEAPLPGLCRRLVVFETHDGRRFGHTDFAVLPGGEPVWSWLARIAEACPHCLQLLS